MYTQHWSISKASQQYQEKSPNLIRGKIRILPGGKRDRLSFVACDRGSSVCDVVIRSEVNRNRALHGDSVYVELLPMNVQETGMDAGVRKLTLSDSDCDGGEKRHEDSPAPPQWSDDLDQKRLWDPLVPIPKQCVSEIKNEDDKPQRSGRVVCIVPPSTKIMTITGMPKKMKDKNRFYFVSNNKSFPFFVVSESGWKPPPDTNDILYSAEYHHSSWNVHSPFPACRNVQPIGKSYCPEAETKALLLEFGIDSAQFSEKITQEVDASVQPGMIYSQPKKDWEWKPPAHLLKDRRDFTKHRIFTIDPTNAKDLDDALHIKPLPNNQVEIGVHIADVTHFVREGSAVDEEASRRATTVYLVDSTVPMLPRPLCEIACSLNENVERLTFSVVWKMNMDGSMVETEKGGDIWYGKSVIKSCARLDYKTAQNIIEEKVVTGDDETLDPDLWPESRRPTQDHTVQDIAHDVRLMHKLTKARRKLRFKNGSLSLNTVKLVFGFDRDQETPTMCEPYPIKDSNKLVEEFMLLANFLVIQRLLTHTKNLALLRNHPPPNQPSLRSTRDAAKRHLNWDIDITSSHTLQLSLDKYQNEQSDNNTMQTALVQMLTSPMNLAVYNVAGKLKPEEWRHYALNIPYYTHFTSPIRRYADVLVHRLLQSTLDGKDPQAFYLTMDELAGLSDRCNGKRLNAKLAQEKSDLVFFSLYLKSHPMLNECAVVTSVGEKTFSVFVPSVGINSIVFLEEHRDDFEFVADKEKKEIFITAKQSEERGWEKMKIHLFQKICVSCFCKPHPPIGVSIRFLGPWTKSD